MILTETGLATLEGIVQRCIEAVGLDRPSRQVLASTLLKRSSRYDNDLASESPDPVPENAVVPIDSGRKVHHQRARVIALRGFSQARSGDFESARETFARAARLDVSLDLRAIPSFWTLPRQAHEAAASALYDVQRNRDAAALLADINTRFRPRLMHSRRR